MIIGIDLGTTNCTMSYTPVQPQDKVNPQVEQIAISQAMDTETLGQLYRSLRLFIIR